MSKTPRINRRRFVGVAAASVIAGVSGMSRTLEAMTDVGIRPSRVSLSESDIADLRERIKATRWPDGGIVGDQSLAKIQELAAYWADDYDWRKCEARLNALPDFVATSGGPHPYAMADSPVGLAAWMLRHDGGLGELTRDEILDRVTLRWLSPVRI